MGAMPWRSVGAIVGIALLGAVAHVNITSTGGYSEPHALVVLAVAAGVGCGSVFAGMAWGAKRKPLAVLFVVCIVAGEAFGLLQTAGRLVAASEAQQAPRREHAEAHTKAVKHVEDARAAVERLPTTSLRLQKAEAAKKTADEAVIAKSAEKGCASNCRQLLQAQADAAVAEIAAARAALEARGPKERAELDAARTALAGMKPPESPTPLADRLGAAPWALDLLVAALGSIAANGLACCLLVFSAHHRPAESKKPRPKPRKEVKATRVEKLAPVEVKPSPEPPPQSVPSRPRMRQKKARLGSSPLARTRPPGERLH